MGTESFSLYASLERGRVRRKDGGGGLRDVVSVKGCVFVFVYVCVQHQLSSLQPFKDNFLRYISASVAGKGGSGICLCVCADRKRMRE